MNDINSQQPLEVQVPEPMDSLETFDDQAPVSSFASIPSPSEYAVQSNLEVHAPNTQTASVNPATGHTVFNRRKAFIVSSVITGLVMVFTGASALFLGSNKSKDNNQAQLNVPVQDIGLEDQTKAILPSELQGSKEAFLVTTDIITRGELKFSNSSFLTVLRPETLTANQTFTLPNASGTLCVDSNNCNYAGIDLFNQLTGRVNTLAGQLGQIQVPAVPASSIVNNQTGSVTIQGTTNQISVTTNNGVITVSTAQDLASTSSPTFSSLLLNGNLAVNGTIDTGLNCTTFLNGGSLTTDASGQLMCADDETSGGGTSVTTVGGTAGTIPVFTAVDQIADSLISQALGIITINGGLTVTGAISGDGLTLTTALTVPNGGTGGTNFTANGLIIGNGAGAFTSTNAASNAQVLLGNGTTPTFTTLSGDVLISAGGVTSIQSDSIALGVDTTGNYLADISVGNGLSLGGAAGEGATRSVSLVVQASKGLEVDVNGLSLIDCGVNQILKYNGSNQWACGADVDTDTTGSFGLDADSGTPETIVNGDTLTITGGNNISTSVGANDTVTVGTVNNPNFTTSVTTPLLQSSGALTITPGGAFTAGATSQTTLLQGSTTTISSSAGNNIVLTRGAGGNIQLTGFNCSTNDNGGVLTTDASGNISCADDNGAAANGITGSGTANRLALFSGSNAVADSWLLQNGSTLTLDNNMSFSINGTGGLSIGGDTINDFVGTGLSLSTGTLQTTLGTSVDLTAEVTGILPVTNGGTGVNGSSAANGTLLIGNGTGYTLATLTAGAGITVNNSAGGIEVVNVFGTSIESSEITDLTVTGADIANDTIALGTKTTGNYVQSVTGNSQISVSGSGSESAAVTLSLVADSIGNAQLEYDTGQALTTSSSPTFGGLTLSGTLAVESGSISSGTATQVGSLSLSDGSNNTGALQTAGLGQNTTFTLPDPGQANVNICLSTGNCAGSGGGVTTAGGTANRVAIFNGAQTVADSWLLQNGSTMQLDNTRNFELIGGNLTLTSGNLNIAGNQTTSGTVTFSGLTNGFLEVNGSGVVAVGAIDLGADTNGNYVATITAGNGISGSSSTEGGMPTIALSNLTADWIQSGAFDLVMDNASAEIRMLESTGGTYYGLFDVGDLSANQTYLFLQGGDVITSGNVATYATTGVTAGSGLTGGGTTGSLTVNIGAGNGITVNANDIEVVYGSAANTAVEGDTQITVTAGTNLSGGGTITLGTGGTITVNVADSPVFAGSVTVQGGLVAAGTTTQAGSLQLSDGSNNTGTIQTTALGANQTYTLPNDSGTICLSTGNCAGSGGGVTTAGGTANRLSFFNGAQTIADSWLLQNGSTMQLDNTRNFELIGGNLTLTSGNISVTGNQTTSGTVTFSALANGFLETNGSGLVSVGTIDLGGDTTGNYVATITNGNGISGSSSSEGGTPTIALGNLTANWVQSGAFDVVYDNAGAELRILESAGGTYYGTFDVGDLSQDEAYTFLQGGTVVTSGNVSSFATTGVTAGSGLTGGGTTGALTLDIGAGNGITVNANDIAVIYGSAANTAVQGNTSITVTAGTNLGGGGSITLGAGGTVTLNVDDSPTFAGTVTVQGASVSIGTASTTTGNLDLYNASSAFAGSVRVATLGQATVYTLPDPGAGSANICLSTGNCAGSGGGVTTAGGTTNAIAKFNGAQSLADSTLSDDGTNVTTSVDLIVQGGALSLGTALQDAALTLYGNGFTAVIDSALLTGNATFNLPDGSGEFCIKELGNCSGSGGGNAPSSSQYLTLALDAGLSAERTLSFNGTNFSVLDGGANGAYTVNTAQNIDTASAPSFAGLALTGNLNLNANTLQGGTAVIDFTNFDVAGNGNVTAGTYNGQTISTAASLTGTLAVANLTTLNGGLTVEAGDTITFNGDAFTDFTGNGLQVSTNVLTLMVQANKGLEVDANGLSLIDCSTGELLKYNGSNQWACASDGTGLDGDSISVNGAAATDVNFINVTATGTGTGTSWTLGTGSNPDEISLTITNASASEAGSVTTGAQTFAGDKTFNGSVVLAAQQTITMVGGTTAQRPASPTEGQIFFDTSTDTLLIYSNGKWQADRAESIIVAASNSTQAQKDSADYVADGTADQTEINAALSEAAGGKVFLLPGTFTVNAPVLVPSNTTLAGSGAGSIITISNSSNLSIALVENSDTTNGNSNISVKDITLDGNRANQTAGGVAGLVLDKVGAANTDGAEISKVNFTNLGSDAVDILNSFNITVEGSIVTNSNNGIYIDTSRQITVINNKFIDPDSSGISGFNFPYGGDYQIIISNNTFTGDNGDISFQGGGLILANNSLSGSGALGLYLEGTGNTITGNTIKGGDITTDGNQQTITGNSISGSSGYGLVLYDAFNSVVSSNIIFNNAGVGIYAESVSSIYTGNNLSNNGGSGSSSGIVVSYGNNNIITNNRITDTAGTGYAIEIETGITGTYLEGNTFSGTGASSILDNGTGTIYGGQLNGSGNYVIEANAGSIELQSNTNITGTLVVSGLITANGGLTIETGDTLTINGDGFTDLTGNGLAVSSNALTLSLQANKGLEVDGNGLSFIDCVDGQVLKYNASNQWACASDAGGAGVGDSISVNGSAADDANFVNTTASGTSTGVTISLNTGTTPDAISVTIGNASATEAGSVTTGAQTFAGDKTFNGSVVLAAQQTITMVGGTTAQRPASPTEGQIYFDTTTKQLLTYANGKWSADSGEYVIVAASNSSQSIKDAADYVADGNTVAALDGDQVQINAALTAAAGGKVFLAPGTYVADATILIPNNTTLLGAGRGTLIELADLDTNENLIENSDTSAGVGVVIQNLRIDGRKDLNTAGNQYGIYLNGLGAGSGAAARQGGRVEGTFINNFRSYGILISGSHIAITTNTLQGNTSGGIYIGGSAHTISDNSVLGNGIGIYLVNGSNNSVTGNKVQGNTSTGIILESFSGQNIISNNLIQSSGSEGLLIFNNSHNNTVTGNVIQSNGTRGVNINSSNANNITGNKLYDNNGTLHNNAIYLFTADSNTITGNSISDTSATTTNYAIDIDNNTSDANYIANNTLGGGTIDDGGTGTIYGGQMNGSGNYVIEANAGSIELQSNTNVTGTLTTSGLITANGGLTIETGDTLTINGDGFTDLTGNGLFVSGSALTLSLQANKGLEVDGNGLSLIDCVNTQILKYNGSNQWVCANDTDTDTDTGDEVLVNGAAVAGANFLNTTATGTSTAVTISLNTTNNPDEISVAIGNASATEAGAVTTGAQTFAGDKTFNGSVVLAAQQTITMVGGTTAQRPASPTEGQIYFDSTTKQLLTYSNGKWQADRVVASKIVAASNAVQSTRDSADYVANGNTGALTDGDQVEINAALNAVSTNGGGTVYLSEGTFTVDASIAIPNNVRLIGAGASTLITIPNSYTNGTNGNIDIVTATGASRTGQAVSNLRIDGNKANNASGTQNGIYFDSVVFGSGTLLEAKIEDVWVENLRTNGIVISSSAGGTISRSNVRNNTTNGIYVIGSGSNNTKIVDSIISSNGTGVYLESAHSGTVISNNQFVSNNNGITAFQAHTITISSNYVSASTNSGIILSSTNDNSILSNNTIVGSAANGIYVSSSVNTLITGNRVQNSGGDSMFIDASRTSIIGNSITDTAGTSRAIHIFSSSAVNTFISNNFIGSGADGVWNAAGPINDVGTSTVYSNQTDTNGNLINRGSAGFTVNTSAVTAALSLQGGLSNVKLPTPGTVTLSVSGTTGATTRRYQITALDGTGETLPSAIVEVTNSNATLSAANRVNVSWTAIPGAVQYRIYRCTAAACTPALLATVSTNSYQDTANGSPSGVLPIVNTTGNLLLDGNGTLSGGTLIVGTSTQAASIVLNDGNGGQTATINLGNITANSVLTLPATLGATDTFCFQTLANCSGTATTLQASYTADIDGSDAVIGLTSTDGALIVRDNSTPLTGTLFAVQNSGGTTGYLTVDTSGIQTSGTVRSLVNTSAGSVAFGTNSTSAGLYGSSSLVGIGRGSNHYFELTSTTSTLNGSSMNILNSNDGGSTELNIRNTFSGGGSIDETSALQFGFGTWNRGARLVGGKEGDFSSAATRSGYFAVETSNSDTVTEKFRIAANGNIYVGNGVTNAVPTAGILQATGGLGSNITGANFTIAGGRGTGTGVGGSLLFQTAAAGLTGTTLNPLTTRMEIQADGDIAMDTDTLFVDAVNNRVGIGDATPLALLTVGTNDALQVNASGNLTTTGTVNADGTGAFGGGHASLGVMIGGGTNGSEIKLRNSGTSHFSIANTGNVLTIGQASTNAGIGSAITPILTMGGGGASTFASTLTIQGSSVTVGTTTQAGSIILNDGNGGQTATINLGNITANSVLTLPATLGATDTFCFQTLANCSGTATTLEQSYLADVNGSDAVINLTSADGGILFRDNVTPLGSTLFAVQNSAGTTNYLRVSATGVTVGGTLSVPGNDAESERFGAGATADIDGTAVGNSASAVCWGSVAVGNAATTGDCVAYSGNIAIGQSAVANRAGIALGRGSSALDYSMALGQLASAAGTNSIALGADATTTTSNQLVINNINDAYIGNGVTNATPINFKLNATGGSGTNISGADLLFAGGRGTGAGNGGGIAFQYAPAGGSGSTANALQTACSISGINGSFSCPGTGGSSERFGSGTTAGLESVAVGNNANASGQYSVAVGRSSTATGRYSAALGYSAATDDDGQVAIGYGANATTGTMGIAIGFQAVGSNTGIAIGRDATNSTFSQSIALGYNATNTANNQFVVNSVSQGFFGNGVTNAAPSNFALNATGGSGTDIAGASLTLAGGRGTGTGVGGNIVFQYAPAGLTGAVANALQTACTISGTNGSLSCPGAGTSSERFGASTIAGGANSLAVGNSATTSTFTHSIAIGHIASVSDNYATALGWNAAAGANSVALGNQANSASGAISIGGNSTASAGNGVAIGLSSNVSSNGSVALGAGASAANFHAVALGGSATAAFVGSIALGDSSITTAANQLVVGSGTTNKQITNAYFGNGVAAASPLGFTLNATGGSGSNVAGASLSLAGGRGTGSAVGGTINFQTTAAGTAGATANTLATVLSLQGGTGAATFQNTTNSSSALRVLTQAGTSAFAIDTTPNSSNLVIEPSFENTSGGTQWANYAAGPHSRTSSEKYMGAQSLQVTTGAGVDGARSYTVDLAPSTTYTFSLHAKLASGSFTTMEMGHNPTNFADVSCLTGQTVTTTGWTKFSCTFTTGASIGSDYVYIKQTDSTARTFYIDAVSVVATSSVVNYAEANFSLNGVIDSPTVFRNVSNSNTAFQIQNAAGGSLLNVDSSNGNISMDTNTLFVDAVNNRVGIGNTNPGFALDVTGEIRSQSNGTTAAPSFNVNGNGGLYAPAAGEIALLRSTTAVFHSNNNSGGTNTINGVINKITASVDGGPTSLLIQNTFGAAGSLDESALLGFDLNSGSPGAAQILVGKEGSFESAAGRSAYMAFSTRYQGTMSERLRITADGNVGIGDASADYKFEVQGTSGTGYLGITNSTDGDILSVTSTGILKVATTASETLASAKLLVTAAEITTALRIGTGTDGVSFNDQTSNKLRLRGTARNDVNVALRPEFEGATFRADGTNNVGVLNSGYCSNEGSLMLNTSVCATSGDDHSYYEWNHSEATAQDYDIVVRYKLPSDFDSGTLDTGSMTIYGWRTDATNNSVQISMYNNAGALCGAAQEAAGTAGQWNALNFSFATNNAGCDAVDAGEYVTFVIKVTADQNDTVRIGEIELTYKSIY